MTVRKLTAFLLIILATTVSSCKDRRQEQPEAERSAFGCYVDSIDSLQMEHELKRLIDSDSSRWKADRQVQQHYDSIGYSRHPLVWCTRMGVSADADSLLCYLRRELPMAGLDTTAFFLPQIAQLLNITHLRTFDSLHVSINEVLPRLDYLLSKVYVRYCTGQRFGFVRPDRLFNHMDYKAHTDNKIFAILFGYDVKAPNYNEAASMLTSPDRMRYLYASRPHGEVYEVLRTKMDTTRSAEHRRLLGVNMERCRWQLEQPESTERRVVVNIPALQLWAICPDSVIEMRICCGTTTNKTPLLSSLITYMQVNPDWIVPQNIVKSDFLRHAGDSAYFARNRYYIVERSTGDTLTAANVTAEEMESGQLRIGQKGGSNNSLGHIVFRFTNDFGIYLHDTNNRRVFDNERRTLSHGCVRVEKPFELACFMLPEADEWLQDRLRISMNIAPVTDRGKEYLKEHDDDEKPLRLIGYQDITPSVPLYIIYYTAYPNPATNELQTWPDIYGYDKAIVKEMAPFLQKYE